MPSIAQMLTHRATLTRAEVGDGTNGRWDKIWGEPFATDVPCRFNGTSLKPFVAEDGRLVADTSRTVYFAPDEDVKAGDRVEAVDEGGYPLGIYTVNALDRQGRVYLKALLMQEQAA